MLRDRIIYLPDKHRFEVEMLYNHHLTALRENRQQALHSLRKFEKQLLKQGKDVLEQTNAVFGQMVQRGVFMKLSTAMKLHPELAELQRHYLVTNIAINQNSKTTPIRLVTDPSRKTGGGPQGGESDRE